MRVVNWLGSLSGEADKSALRLSVAYFLALAVAETLVVVVNPLFGIIIHIVIMVALLVQSSLVKNDGTRELLLSLVLVPLIRIISLSLPLRSVPQVWWYPIIYIPLVVASFQVMRLLGLKREQVGLVVGKIPTQLLIACSGPFIGFTEYFILRHEATLTFLVLGKMPVLSGLFLLVFTGFVEEFMFRGILQYASIKALGRGGIIYVSLLFGIAHLIHLSLLDVAFVSVVALFFSLIVEKTGSLLGVTLSHGIANVILFLVAPLVF